MVLEHLTQERTKTYKNRFTALVYSVFLLAFVRAERPLPRNQKEGEYDGCKSGISALVVDSISRLCTDTWRGVLDISRSVTKHLIAERYRRCTKCACCIYEPFGTSHIYILDSDDYLTFCFKFLNRM